MTVTMAMVVAAAMIMNTKLNQRLFFWVSFMTDYDYGFGYGYDIGGNDSDDGYYEVYDNNNNDDDKI